MGPDYWFVIAGVAALCMGAVNLAGALHRRRSRAFVSGCLWLCLSAGLLLQGYSPHPVIRDRSFVMPVANGATGTIDPIGMVHRTRWMHQLSLLTTVIGAAGLAFCYRRRLFEPRGDHNPE